MHRPLRVALLLPVILVALAIPAAASVTFYTDLASFEAAVNGSDVLAATFESHALGSSKAFTEGTVAFAAHPPLNNLAFIGTTVPLTNTNPTPHSKVLTGNGTDDMDVTPPAAIGGVGFETITNRFNPATVTVYAIDGSVMATYTLTQARNTYGYLGIVSTVAIGTVRWLGVTGETQNTAIDNVSISPLVSPATSPTWGRLKGLYR